MNVISHISTNAVFLEVMKCNDHDCLKFNVYRFHLTHAWLSSLSDRKENRNDFSNGCGHFSTS